MPLLLQVQGMNEAQIGFTLFDRWSFKYNTCFLRAVMSFMKKHLKHLKIKTPNPKKQDSKQNPRLQIPAFLSYLPKWIILFLKGVLTGTKATQCQKLNCQSNGF